MLIGLSCVLFVSFFLFFSFFFLFFFFFFLFYLKTPPTGLVEQLQEFGESHIVENVWKYLVSLFFSPLLPYIGLLCGSDICSVLVHYF